MEITKTTVNASDGHLEEHPESYRPRVFAAIMPPMQYRRGGEDGLARTGRKEREESKVYEILSNGQAIPWPSLPCEGCDFDFWVLYVESLSDITMTRHMAILHNLPRAASAPAPLTEVEVQGKAYPLLPPIIPQAVWDALKESQDMAEKVSGAIPIIKPIMGSSGNVQIGEIIEYNLVPQANGDNPLEKIMEQKRFEETDVERLAKFIAQKESRNCKTLDDAIHHQSKWQRIVPEAREMLESALVSVQDLSLHLHGKCTDHIWLMNDGPEPHTLGIRMDCGDSGVVYLTHEQAADLADQLKSMLEVKGPDNKPN